MKDNREKTYLYVWVMCFLYVLPLIIANRYVYDDTQRVFYHTAGWALDGRPLTELLMKLLCDANNFIYDIFPLPLILSVTAYTIAAVKWTEKYFSSSMAVNIIASFLPLSMPFFLSNLSYRFDCAGFTASVILLMLPFILRGNIRWKNFLISFICVIASMCFYQPTVGLFIGLSLLVAFIAFTEGEKFISDLVSDALAFAAGCVIYKLVISEIFVDKQDWRADANSLVASSADIARIGAKIKRLLLLCEKFARSVGIRQFIIYALIWILGGIVLFMLMKEKKPVLRIATAAIYCVLPAVLFFASIMPMMALSASYAVPRQQSELMILMFLLAYCLAVLSKKYPRTAAVLGFVAVLFHFSFSYAYGNLMKVQKEYEGKIVYEMLDEIDALGNDEADEISVWNEMPYSPVVERTCELMPIYADMVPGGFDGDGMLGGAIINHYSRKTWSIVDISEKDREFMDANEPFAACDIYEIYLNGNRICVRFSDDISY
ncbi:MAG: glucosyltransferase domain-containing protein [Lachnospiraceae bacterium]|nr:glucosyltransferase domain-containing protein [Lachnospiraceae bacterium]